MGGPIWMQMEAGTTFREKARYGSRMRRPIRTSTPMAMEAGYGIPAEAMYGHRAITGAGHPITVATGPTGTDLAGGGYLEAAVVMAEWALGAAVMSSISCGLPVVIVSARFRCTVRAEFIR
jgi:hypothetical protein